jgi:hypothetical protein
MFQFRSIDGICVYYRVTKPCIAVTFLITLEYYSNFQFILQFISLHSPSLPFSKYTFFFFFCPLYSSLKNSLQQLLLPIYNHLFLIHLSVLAISHFNLLSIPILSVLLFYSFSFFLIILIPLFLDILSFNSTCR